jgi:hypothetical protein
MSPGAFERDLASLVELWEEPIAEEWPFKDALGDHLDGGDNRAPRRAAGGAAGGKVLRV